MKNSRTEIPAVRSGIRVLGIDPGSRVSGYALIVSGKKIPRSYKDFEVNEIGVMRADQSQDFLPRIGQLHDKLSELVAQFRPDFCVIEDSFFGMNARSALKLGQVKGALACAAMRGGVPTVDIAPREVKSAVTGNGAATKEQVCQTLEILMGIKLSGLPHDATDALAIALSFGLKVASRQRVRAPILGCEKAGG